MAFLLMYRYVDQFAKILNDVKGGALRRKLLIGLGVVSIAELVEAAIGCGVSFFLCPLCVRMTKKKKNTQDTQRRICGRGCGRGNERGHLTTSVGSGACLCEGGGGMTRR